MLINDQIRTLRETMCQVLERVTDPISYHHTFRSVLLFAESCLPQNKVDFSDTKPLDEDLQKKICDIKATKEDINAVRLIHTNNNKLLRDALIHLIDEHNLTVYDAVAEIKNVLANRNHEFSTFYNEPLKAAAINCMDTTHVFEKIQLDAAHAMITALGKKAADAFSIVTGTHGDELAILPAKILWAKNQVQELATNLAKKGHANLDEIKSIATAISQSTEEMVTVQGDHYSTFFFDKAIIGSLFTFSFNQTLLAQIAATAANVTLALTNSTQLVPIALKQTLTNSTQLIPTVLNQTLTNVTQSLAATMTPPAPETFLMLVANHVQENPEIYTAISIVAVLAFCFRNKIQTFNPVRFAANKCNFFNCLPADNKKYDDVPAPESDLKPFLPKKALG